MAQRYIKFFGSAWRADQGLRKCSEAARGIWIDCISLMIEAEPYGHLVDENGNAATAEDIGKLIGSKAAVVERCIEELKRRKVCSINEAGVIYSRRMIKDKAKQEEARVNGKGGGNPALKPIPSETITQGVNPNDNGEVKTHTCVPSTISHQPSAAADGDSGLELIRAFDRAIAAVFGNPRPWPNQLDLQTARRMLSAGVSPQLVEDLTRPRCERMKAEGKAPPTALKFIEAACIEAITSGKAVANFSPSSLSKTDHKRLMDLALLVECDAWRPGGERPSLDDARAEIAELEAKSKGIAA